jgi:hypothetical protein
MAILPGVGTILADDAQGDAPGDESKSERIERLIEAAGWDAVRDSILAILRADRRPQDDRTATEVLWGAALDRRPMPADRVIALLYHRLERLGGGAEGLDENLAWSITSTLKCVGYLSDYDPLNDPAVQAELAALCNSAGPA